MLIQGNFWFVGRLTGNKLMQPRIYRIIQDPQNKNQQLIQLEPLPHFPPFLNASGCISYPILLREKNLIDLYARVTSPEAEKSYDPAPPPDLRVVEKGKSGIIMPGGN
jgi:hypothetical protein